MVRWPTLNWHLLLLFFVCLFYYFYLHHVQSCISVTCLFNYTVNFKGLAMAELTVCYIVNSLAYCLLWSVQILFMLCSTETTLLLMWIQRDASIPISHCQSRLRFLTRFALFIQQWIGIVWHNWPSEYEAFSIFYYTQLVLLVHPWHKEKEGLLVCLDFQLNVYVTFCIRTQRYIL